MSTEHVGAAPTCDRCGRAMRLESHFKLDHEDTDSPGMTLQLVQTLADLRAAGAGDTIGADVTLWVCDPCDIAVADFAHPDEPEP